VYKSMGADEMPPRVLRELAGEVAKPLSYLKSHGRLVKFPVTGKGETSCPFLKREKNTPGNHRSVSLTSVLYEIMEQILLETMLRHMENREVIGDSQHSFTKGKSCLTNLVAFYKEVMALVDKGRTNYVTYLDSCKAFDTTPHNILLSKMESHGFDGWTSQRIRNWLDGRTQRVVVSGLMSGWRPVTSGI